MPFPMISRCNLLAAFGVGAIASLPGCRGGGGGGGRANWSSLDKVLSDAVAAEDAPFLVAAVSDRKGTVWQGAAGEARPNLPASQDVVFYLASATKAIGSLAAMILLDRGKVSLDTKIADVLPEFGAVQVVDSISPRVLRAPVTPVTLRHLLTHTSGLAYTAWNQKAFDYANSFTPPLPSGAQDWNQQLMFDPGTAWAYGYGIDWAGILVQKIDGRSIDRFVREEIFEPLQMRDSGFEADSVAARLVMNKVRRPDGSLMDFPLNRQARPAQYGMGGAIYGTALDYLKFLRLILNDGMANGRRVLSSASVALMKQNQIGGMRLPFPTITTSPASSAGLDLFPGENIPLTHTAAFVRNEIDVPGRRRAGSLTWAGLMNTHYWVDPSSGIAAVLFSQHLPFIEPRFLRVFEAFEKAVYRELSHA